ncbi:hypothetical protein QA646_19300 (plasmid) [Rhizobium sp. CB3090]|uniref:hypothetical protein n=1 Tax=Rhizobium sp. CB3090 TaxID=3039156 RepID=UPI0024B142E2|nr:hypothetical protein [Rhizobium sp. CB3090]WFU12090.1 hypothetical protein QA646_19300 [Rhizobium sp. CB3090]
MPPSSAITANGTKDEPLRRKVDMPHTGPNAPVEVAAEIMLGYLRNRMVNVTNYLEALCAQTLREAHGATTLSPVASDSSFSQIP